MRKLLLTLTLLLMFSLAGLSQYIYVDNLNDPFDYDVPANVYAFDNGTLNWYWFSVAQPEGGTLNSALTAGEAELISTLVSIPESQIAVGTGTTIEGDPNFRWNGETFRALGHKPFMIDSTGINYPDMNNLGIFVGEAYRRYVAWDELTGYMYAVKPDTVPGLESTGFERIIETDTGWTWVGDDRTNKGPIGQEALDASLFVPDPDGNDGTLTGTNYGATGFGSVAFGNKNISSGDYSIAGGMGNQATSWQSFAWGSFNKAQNINDVAFGQQNTVNGPVSAAIATRSSNVQGTNSVAIGGTNQVVSQDNMVGVPGIQYKPLATPPPSPTYGTVYLSSADSLLYKWTGLAWEAQGGGGGIGVETDPIYSAWNKDYNDLINTPNLSLKLNVSDTASMLNPYLTADEVVHPLGNYSFDDGFVSVDNIKIVDANHFDLGSGIYGGQIFISPDSTGGVSPALNMAYTNGISSQVGLSSGYTEENPTVAQTAYINLSNIMGTAQVELGVNDDGDVGNYITIGTQQLTFNRLTNADIDANNGFSAVTRQWVQNEITYSADTLDYGSWNLNADLTTVPILSGTKVTVTGSGGISAELGPDGSDYILSISGTGLVETETDPIYTAWDKDYADLTNKPTTITPTQASDIIANNAKISYTDAAAVALNTAKVSGNPILSNVTVDDTTRWGIDNIGTGSEFISQYEPIRLHPDNPHYFEWRGEPTILLTSGGHYGNVTTLDMSIEDNSIYLNALQADNLNYTRIFAGGYAETTGSYLGPNLFLAPPSGRLIQPWARSSTPGYANGGNKFDLDVWDTAYFRRLHSFISDASKRGIVVEVTLLCPFYTDEIYALAPFNNSNNVNNVTSTVTRTTIYSDTANAIVDYIDAYVEKMVMELQPYDNIFWEPFNEPYSTGLGVSVVLQNRMIDLISELESNLPNKHLIAINVGNFNKNVTELDPPQTFTQVSPEVDIINTHYAARSETYTTNHFTASNLTLNRVLANDENGNTTLNDYVGRKQAWRWLVAGGGSFNSLDFTFSTTHPSGDTLPYSTLFAGGIDFRNDLEFLVGVINSVDFINMTPHNDLPKAGGIVSAHTNNTELRCLANDGQEYLMWIGGNGGTSSTSLTLNIPTGIYDVVWYKNEDGSVLNTETITSDGTTPVVTTSASGYLDKAVTIKKVPLELPPGLADEYIVQWDAATNSYESVVNAAGTGGNPILADVTVEDTTRWGASAASGNIVDGTQVGSLASWNGTSYTEDTALHVDKTNGWLGVGAPPKNSLMITNTSIGENDMPGGLNSKNYALALTNVGTSAGTRPGLVQYAIRDVAGGIAYDILSGYAGTSLDNVKKMATVGVYGAATTASAAYYIYLSASQTGTWNNNTLKIDYNNKVGIALPSSTRPNNTLDVEGNASIGSTYSGSLNAPTNGLIVEGTVGLGTSSPASGSALDVVGDVLVNGDFILTGATVPASSTSTGTAGMISADANYIYICVATNTWKRVAISTW